MSIRYRDILAVIGRASDVGMARPEDTAERTALAAHRIATVAGHSQREIRDAVYVSLLRGGENLPGGNSRATPGGRRPRERV